MTILRYNLIDEYGNKKSICDDTTQPFRRRDGTWLPPLELPAEKELPPEPIVTDYRGLIERFERWMGSVVYLQNKLNTYIETSKKKKKGRYLS